MTPAIASRMCPGAPLRNIEANLPCVLSALSKFGIGDRQMQLMAVATICVETGEFEPISEFQSRWNTAPGGEPFALYGPGTRIGANLGNTQPGDGSRFRGRGFIQLTGRGNYAKYGPIVGEDLIANPGRANDPTVAAELLAAFLKDHEPLIRTALAAGDLAKARKLVNGGSHGLDEFARSYRVGDSLLG